MSRHVTSHHVREIDLCNRSPTIPHPTPPHPTGRLATPRLVYQLILASCTHPPVTPRFLEHDVRYLYLYDLTFSSSCLSSPRRAGLFRAEQSRAETDWYRAERAGPGRRVLDRPTMCLILLHIPFLPTPIPLALSSPLPQKPTPLPPTSPSQFPLRTQNLRRPTTEEVRAVRSLPAHKASRVESASVRFDSVPIRCSTQHKPP